MDVDRTEFTLQDNRKKERPLSDVWALVLHQTAFSRGNDPALYNRTKAHFLIVPDGTVVQLHPMTNVVWASHGFNNHSVAVEIVGNFRSDRHKYYKPHKYGQHDLTVEQAIGGFRLIEYLIKEAGIRNVLTHRQASNNKSNCPGPDIWCNIGERAIERYDIGDGGPQFKVGTGKPIPDSWRYFDLQNPLWTVGHDDRMREIYFGKE